MENGKDFTDVINPKSLEILKNCKLEPSLANVTPESRFQFERLGYFCVDAKESNAENPVFNRTVTLRDMVNARQKTVPINELPGLLK